MIPVDQIIQGFICLAVLGAIRYGLMPLVSGFFVWAFRFCGVRR